MKELVLITKDNDEQGILKKVLSPVVCPKDELKTLEQMVEIMGNDGVGISANQVGLDKRMFVFTLNNGELEYAINPVILVRFNGFKSAVEGCLSYPDKFVKVRRLKRIKVQYHNGKEMVTRELKNMAARIFQHELNHLDGQCILGR